LNPEKLIQLSFRDTNLEYEALDFEKLYFKIKRLINMRISHLFFSNFRSQMISSINNQSLFNIMQSVHCYILSGSWWTGSMGLKLNKMDLNLNHPK